MTETIVCLAAPHVDSIGLAEGFSAVDTDLLRRLLVTENLWLGPRPRLETDESYRQLVSYVVFRYAQTVLVYRRTPKGGETRLHGLLSVGVGGHVNATDLVSNAGTIDIDATLQQACRREIDEEVQCSPVQSLETIGIIKESQTPVSRVHLGVVVECRLLSPQVRTLDPGLVDAHFVEADALSQLSDQMETWSSSLIEHLRRTR